MNSNGPLGTDSVDSAEQTTDEQSTDTPAVTLRASGPVTYRRALGDESIHAVATHESVHVEIKCDLAGPTEFQSIVERSDYSGELFVNDATVIDELLDSLENGDGYNRRASPDEWELEITGTATDWKRLMLALVTDENAAETAVDEQAAKDATRRLRGLIEDDTVGTGAALAALDLINEHDLAFDTELYHTKLQECELGTD